VLAGNACEPLLEQGVERGNVGPTRTAAQGDQLDRFGGTPNLGAVHAERQQRMF
jgi:hypothetical protein